MLTADAHRGRRAGRAGCRDDRGAALVEFALVMPVLFLLIFGIIEFGWAFGEFLDVRQGARETARLAAVNYQASPGLSADEQSAALVAEACGRLSTSEGSSITLTFDDSIAGDAERRAVGRPATVVVSRELDTLTGFLDFAIGGKELTSSAQIRLEQRATWNTATSYTGLCDP